MSVQPQYRSAQPLTAGTPGPAISFFSVSSYLLWSGRIVCLYCLCAGLSIAVTQIAIVSLLTYSVAVWYFAPDDARADVSRRLFGFPFGVAFAAAIGTWLAASLVSAVTGINPSRSSVALIKSAWYVLFPFVIACSLTLENNFEFAVARVRKWLAFLLLGQSIAGIHSVLSAVMGHEIKPGVPGPVTESGQLVLVLPALFAMFAANVPEATASRVLTPRILRDAGTAALSILVIIMCWPETVTTGAITLTHVQIGALAVSLWLCAALVMQKPRKLSSWLYPSTALLFAVLVINLKRGPWLGVLIEMLLLALFVSRRFFAFGLALSLTAVMLLAPVRDRLGSLVDHFEIEGGRRSMWAIGVDLIERFPLGLGLENAQHMREIDPSLPLLHRHMHNNVLNVAVESGWLGVAAYVWWMSLAIAFGFVIWRNYRNAPRGDYRHSIAAICLCLSCAIAGWQTSGLVEYNFGDGEVQFIALFYMGILLGFGAMLSSASAPHQPRPDGAAMAHIAER